MTILTRYILKQHIGPFFFSFSIISLLWILNLLFKELNRFLSKGLPFGVILEFFGLSMGWIIALSIPMATLTASLMAYGRMSSDNEITAIKASGISFYRILAPTVFAAVMLAWALIGFNNVILPEMNHRLRMLLYDINRKKPTVKIEPGVWFDDLDNFSMLVGEVADSGSTSLIRDVMVNDYSTFNAITNIVADRGSIRVNNRTGYMEIMLHDGEMQKVDIKNIAEFQRLHFKTHLIRINVASMFMQRSDQLRQKGDREKSAQVMRAEVDEIGIKVQEKAADIESQIAGELLATFGQTFGVNRLANADSLAGLPIPGDDGAPRSSKKLSKREVLLNTEASRHSAVMRAVKAGLRANQNYRRQQNKLRVEIHKKYAIPFACIVFVLVGAPLGIMARSGGIAFGVGVSIFFFITFWASLITGEDLADRGQLSPLVAMWRANVFVGTGGLALLIMLLKETRFTQFLKENWLKFILIGFIIDWLREDRGTTAVPHKRIKSA